MSKNAKLNIGLFFLTDTPQLFITFSMKFKLLTMTYEALCPCPILPSLHSGHTGLL